MPPPADPLLARTEIDSVLDRARTLLATNPSAALEQVEKILKSGANARALRLVAEAHRQLDQHDRSGAAELLAIEANLADPRLIEAARAEQQKRSADAARIATDFLKSEPDDLLALTILAEALVSMRQLANAEDALLPVVTRAPGFVQAGLLLGKCLQLQCRLREAIDQVNKLVGNTFDIPPARRFLAQLFSEVGDFERAVLVYEQLLAAEDRDGDLWLEYGQALRFAGRRNDAESAFRRALALDGSNGSAWWNLTNMSPEAIEPDDVDTMERALAWLLANDDEVDDASQIHIALGTLLDRSKEHDQALGHIVAGKALLARKRPYDPQLLTTQVDHAIETFTSDFYSDREGWGSDDRSPIFIIGMPRSGSTLVERILGGHSRIEATGELPIVPRLIDELDGEAGFAGGHQQLLATMSQDRIRELGTRYLERSREFRRTDRPFFTDKLHMNWRSLGLIRLILPQAKIIDVRRDAVDCCWSNFKSHFANGHPASNNLAHIGRFYRDYVRFSDHMASLAPNELLNLRYEMVVEEVESETRRILSFLGHDYEPACLKFHQLEGPIATASSEQVRRPLNREGIGSSQPYRQWLEPLIDALGPLAAES